MGLVRRTQKGSVSGDSDGTTGAWNHGNAASKMTRRGDKKGRSDQRWLVLGQDRGIRKHIFRSWSHKAALIKACQFHHPLLTKDHGSRHAAVTCVMMVLMGSARAVRAMFPAGQGRIERFAILPVVHGVRGAIHADRLLFLMDRVSKRTHPQPGENAEQQEMGQEMAHAKFLRCKTRPRQTKFRIPAASGRGSDETRMRY